MKVERPEYSLVVASYGVELCQIFRLLHYVSMFLNISRFALQFYVFQLNYSLWEVVKVIRVSISITSLCSLNNFFDREPF